MLFTPNAVTVISDGTTAAMSSFSGGFEHYAPWKTIDGREVVTNLPALEVLIKGVFDQARFLDIVAQLRGLLTRRVRSGLRQARRQVPPVLGGQRCRRVDREAAGPTATGAVVSSGTPRASGKCIEMLLYAAKIMRDPRMNNPTLVFITDRNDLDDQLFGEVFAPAAILPEKPSPGRNPRRPADAVASVPRAASSSRPCRSSRPERGRRPQPGAD